MCCGPPFRDAKEPGAVPMGDLETPKYMGPWGHGAMGQACVNLYHMSQFL